MTHGQGCAGALHIEGSCGGCEFVFGAQHRRGRLDPCPRSYNGRGLTAREMLAEHWGGD